MDMRRHEHRVMVDLALRMYLIQCELPGDVASHVTNQDRGNPAVG
jgi:hypothetical protein